MTYDAQAIFTQGRAVEVAREVGGGEEEFSLSQTEKSKEEIKLYKERKRKREYASFMRRLHPERFRLADKKYRQANLEEINKRNCARMKRLHAENPEKSRKTKRESYARNSASYIARAKKWKAANREKVNDGKRRIHGEKMKSDPNYAITVALRSRLGAAMKDAAAKKFHATLELVGCTVDFLREYLEARFKPGMTWKNRNQWHIDHIIPCAKFDLTDPKQQRACFRYSNLQPLWKSENLSKSAKIPKNHHPELI